MMRRPFMWRNKYTTAPTGHSTMAAAANAMNPTVGPTTLHRQGLLFVPHCTHNGNPPTIFSVYFGCTLYLLVLWRTTTWLVDQNRTADCWMLIVCRRWWVNLVALSVIYRDICVILYWIKAAFVLLRVAMWKKWDVHVVHSGIWTTRVGRLLMVLRVYGRIINVL